MVMAGGPARSSSSSGTGCDPVTRCMGRWCTFSRWMTRSFLRTKVSSQNWHGNTCVFFLASK